MSLVGNPDQANDIMQETNIVLWQKADTFELGTNFPAWMMRVAHFQVLAHRQRITRQRWVFDDETIALLAAEVEERDNLLDEQTRIMHGCLAHLNDRHRTVLQARYTDGVELDSLAARFNMKVNAIKQLLFRARAALIECVRLNAKTSAT